ncbi:uncharacterized protein [Drosophila kikkawai]|uniref:Endonuclease/exonuclease/phosphatase domain-containing protein n=1 Tax=Drosophila kikkawai TaxID=30033 RepID=A0ABM4GBD3_DROKI
MTPQVSYRIWDLDDLTTKEKLDNALVKQANLPPSSVTVKGICALASGSQAATFTVSAGLAGALNNLGKVKVGWTRCRIKELEPQLSARSAVANGPESGTDLAVLSEPYRGGRNHDWAVDSSGKTALRVYGNTSLRLENVLTDQGFVRAKAGGWWIYSIYLAPSLTLAEFAVILDRLAADARGRSPTLLAGDFNAWAVDWGSATTNARGRTLLEVLSTLDVALLNRAEATGDTEDMANSVMSQVLAPYEECIPSRTIHSRHRDSVYWWNQEIAEARKDCVRSRRQYQRSHGFQTHLVKRETYHRCRRALRAAIKGSKRKCFLDLCEAADPWGNAYKIIVKKVGRANNRAPLDAESLEKIVAHIFPRMTKAELATEAGTYPLHELEPVSEEEMLAVTARIKVTKAPGPYCVPKRALKLAICLRPDIFAVLFGKCMREGLFSSRWKAQRLVPLPKPGKPWDDPASFRPICLIDGAGKVLEYLISSRLEGAIVASGGLSDSQYELMKAMSTVDAITKVVDIASTAIAGQRWKEMMLRSEENWQGVSSFAATILAKLRIEERRRNQEQT